MPWVFSLVPENASDIYKKAWDDGCNSGLANMTNSAYSFSYKFRQDPELREDPTYYKVWRDTYTFCRHYAYGHIRQADGRRSLPNDLSSQLSRFVGQDNIFDKGFLGQGPGDAGYLFSNWGNMRDGLNIFPQGGVMDFSNEGLLTGHTQGMNGIFDYRPKHAVVPY